MSKINKLLDIHSQIRPHILKTKSQFLSSFINPEQFRAELIFCLCTPQSNAKRAWESTLEIMDKRLYSSIPKMAKLLGEKGVRFKNNKAVAIYEANKNFKNIFSFVHSHRSEEQRVLRNSLSELVKGYGLKESSHFLRNIGHGNDICILDRHIMRCLVEYDVISEIPQTLTKKTYLSIEQQMLAFSKQIKISPDDLDFVFWYHQNGEIFK